MDYTIARELKDAGWPQKAGGPYAVKDPATRGRHNQELAYTPTLEELINASPMLHGISRYRNGRRSVKGWWVFGLKSELDSFSEWYEGSTLEEALARYWLAVHNRE